MEQNNDRIRLELTDAQRKQIKAARGDDVRVLELDVRELEQRVNPLLVVIA